MKRLNATYLDQIVSPWLGVADDGTLAGDYLSLDVDDPEVMKPLIRKDILPDFEACSAERRENIKLALRYLLSNPNSDFQRLLDSGLVPLAEPKDPRRLYQWIWEVLFPGQDSFLPDWKEYRVE